MNDETTELHPNAGAAGATGAHGDPGTNAAGRETNAASGETEPAPAATGGLRLEPAGSSVLSGETGRGQAVEVPAATGARPAFVAVTAEAQIVEALVNAGYGADEAVQLAQAAVAEIQSRKRK